MRSKFMPPPARLDKSVKIGLDFLNRFPGVKLYDKNSVLRTVFQLKKEFNSQALKYKRHILTQRFHAQTHTSANIFCSKPIQEPKFQSETNQSTNIYSHTQLSTRILFSKPIFLPRFYYFWENEPLIYLHQPFKPIHLNWAYVFMKICEYPQISMQRSLRLEL